MSETWHPFISESDFPAEGKVSSVLAGWHVLVAQFDGNYHAVNDRCTHQASLLSTGKIRRGAVMCPLHGARFELASGRCLGAAYADLKTFAVRVRGGQIEVAVPDAPPGLEDLPIAF